MTSLCKDILTADHTPGTFSAGQSILLQSRVPGPVGLAWVHCESGRVLKVPLVTSWRQTIWRVWTPFPHVLEQGRQPETYQLNQGRMNIIMEWAGMRDKLTLLDKWEMIYWRKEGRKEQGCGLQLPVKWAETFCLVIHHKKGNTVTLDFAWKKYLKEGFFELIGS